MPAKSGRTQHATDTAAPDALRAILHDLVEPPDEAVDEALDIATACLARHGVAHTSVPLLAKYLGVSRATVYSQFGSVEDIARRIMIRDVSRFIDSLPAACMAPGPEGVMATMAAAIRFGRDHSIIAKVVADEPAVIAEMLPHAEVLLSLGRRPLARHLRAAMAEGLIRGGNPDAVADLLMRVVITSIVMLPPGQLATYLDHVLGPVLVP